MARFTSNTIYNEMIMKIIGLFAKIDVKTQIHTGKTVAKTIERQHNTNQMQRESLEEKEHLLREQQELMQALTELEEVSGLQK